MSKTHDVNGGGTAAHADRVGRGMEEWSFDWWRGGGKNWMDGGGRRGCFGDIY